MNIHFTASLTGKKIYEKSYLRMVDAMCKVGHRVTEAVLTRSVGKVLNQTREENIQIYSKIRSQIEKSDLLVAETSYPSVAVGFEIMMALNLGKQVLALHLPDKNSPLLEGVNDKHFYYFKYEEINLETVLLNNIKTIEADMDVRFNFLLSKELLSRLDWMAKKSGVNKSEYVRQQIEKDMRRNKRYKNNNGDV
ncbi:hypothetical protein KKD37_03490 [Patescibacteria group bacterium]|nr:hypothetical protein [Patescibacteria group bacterium]